MVASISVVEDWKPSILCSITYLFQASELDHNMNVAFVPVAGVTAVHLGVTWAHAFFIFTMLWPSNLLICRKTSPLTVHEQQVAALIVKTALP